MQYNLAISIKRIATLHQTRFFLFPLMILLCSCFNHNAANSDQVSEATDSAARITVQLKSNERLFFAYYDDLFRDQMIIFSNPSNKDTAITKKIFLTSPAILSWQFLITESGKKRKYSFLVKPNDDLHFGTLFPNIYPINNFVFLTDSTDVFFTTNYFPSRSGNKLDSIGKEKLNEQFLANLEKGYNAALDKIGKEFKSGRFDTAVFENKKRLIRSHFYGEIFTVAESVSPNNKTLKAKIAAERNNINAFIKQKPPVTWDLITTLKGIKEIDFKNTRSNSADYWEMYNAILKDQDTSYRMPLLLYMLSAPIPQNDDEFSGALNAFNTLFPDKKYLTDSILNAKTPIINSENNDSFVTMDGTQHKWKDLININSDKIVIVDVWASWCAPCRALFPAFDSVKKILNKESYRFVSINIDESKSDWEVVSKNEKQFLPENNFYLEKASQSYFIKTFRIQSIPRIIVLKNGKVLNSDFYVPIEESFVRQLKSYITR